MTGKRVIFFGLFLCLATSLLARKQALDSIPDAGPQWIVPAGVLAAGILGNEQIFKRNLHAALPRTDTRLDDYFQFVPIGQLYLAEAVGLQGNRTVWSATKNLFLAEMFTGLAVYGLKWSLNVERPNGERWAWPSGHTAQGFVGATALHCHYRKTHPWLARSGFLFAATTGALRVTNDVHWVPDVLAGAGIALLITRLVYYWNPLEDWHPFSGVRVSRLRVDPTGGAIVLNF
jgi:membrane-associated phospholipid phosphatase